ncbi:hypothetical protein, partial [Mycolicibacterium aubagnense]|uniref:hypothetical protein n=2 Tax=Mycolicibacterium aubagnense TaxID=319707 RepID=UPI0012888301
LEESRDDLQSLGYDTPVPLIRSDSYTTLMDATDEVCESQWQSATFDEEWRISGNVVHAPNAEVILAAVEQACVPARHQGDNAHKVDVGQQPEPRRDS